MRLSLSQKEKYEELFKAVEILFNNNSFGLMYSEIEEAWIIGEALRDLLLFKNPPISEYNFYLQVKDKESIYPWLSRLAEKDLPFEVIEEISYFDSKVIYQKVLLSLQKFGIDYEINIIIGNIDAQKFMGKFCPIATSLLCLDISDLFIALGKKERVEKISKYIWSSNLYKKDIKNKTITVLKQDWMTNPTNYTYLESYLEKTYQKLSVLGFK